MECGYGPGGEVWGEGVQGRRMMSGAEKVRNRVEQRRGTSLLVHESRSGRWAVWRRFGALGPLSSVARALADAHGWMGRGSGAAFGCNARHVGRKK
jgi:hypothetical protein